MPTQEKLPLGVSLNREIQGHANDKRIYSLAWSPDGRYLASGSLDYEISVWDAQIGSCLYVFSGHSLSVYSIAWSPDGKTLARVMILSDYGILKLEEFNRYLKDATQYTVSLGLVMEILWPPVPTMGLSHFGMF